MPSSCSHWWHAPVYIVATVALIVAAISSSSSYHPPPSDLTSPKATPPPLITASGDVSPDAILTLHRAGFHLTAEILRISRGSLLPNTRPTTVFAVPDVDLANLSFAAAKHLFRYHTVPLRLSLSDLNKMPRGSCLPTLLKKDLFVTASDGMDRSISINGVPISLHTSLSTGPTWSTASANRSTDSTAKILPPTRSAV